MWVKSTENATPSSDPKNHHKEVIFKRANVTAGEYKTVQNCSHGGATSRAAAAWRFADWVDALTAAKKAQLDQVIEAWQVRF